MMQIDRDSQTPIYQQIADALRQQIIQGELQPGQKLPARLTLVQMLDVNLGTLRNALELLTHQGLLVSRTGSGTYVSQDALRILEANHPQVSTVRLDKAVFVVGKKHLPELKRDIMDIVASILVGFDEVLGERHGGCRFVESVDEQLMGDGELPGLVMIYRPRSVDVAVIDKLRAANVPVINVWNRRDDMILPCIGHDAHDGIELATRHLLEMGYRRLGYIGDMGSNTPMSANFYAFTNVLYQAGLDFQVRHVRNVSQQPGEAYNAARQLIKGDLPDAILVDADWRAMEVLTALRHAGLHVPQDIGVIGHDGLAEAQDMNPKLTTLATPRIEAGREIARQWLALVDHQQPMHSVMLPARLLKGATTAPFTAAEPNSQTDDASQTSHNESKQ